MQLSTTVRESILNAIDDDLSTAAEVRFFVSGGATPTSEAAAITLNNPAFNAASTGTMALNTTTALEDATPAGNASPVTRLCFYLNTAAADNAWLLQLGIGSATGADVTMSNATIATSDTVQISSLSLVCPEGTPTTA